MSTRSCIARKTSDTGFIGVYHHWDGYPSGLGKTLFDLYRGHFSRDLKAMLAFLIDAHPAGWSSINNADFSLTAGFHERYSGPCKECGMENWKHYRQYYRDKGLSDLINYLKPDGEVKVLGHSYQKIETPKGPECFCHGSRNGEACPVDETSDFGMGWAYVFDESAEIMYIFERLYNPNAGPGVELFSGRKIEDMSFSHMTGMFGAGADGNQHWAIAAKIDLANGEEPIWDEVSAAKYLIPT